MWKLSFIYTPIHLILFWFFHFFLFCVCDLFAKQTTKNKIDKRIFCIQGWLVTARHNLFIFLAHFISIDFWFGRKNAKWFAFCMNCDYFGHCLIFIIILQKQKGYALMLQCSIVCMYFTLRQKYLRSTQNNLINKQFNKQTRNMPAVN